MRRLLHDYGLSIALALIFLASWIVQSAAGWIEFEAQQKSHGETATLFGPSGYLWPWLQATFENWQSEFLQLFTMVVFTAFLIHRGSHESRDSDQQLYNAIVRLEERLIDLETQGLEKQGLEKQGRSP